MTDGSAPRITRIALVSGTLWVAHGLLNVAAARAVMHLSGVAFPAALILRRELASTVLWILFTPLTVQIARRFPLRAERRIHYAVVALAILVLSMLRAAVGGMAERNFESVPVSWQMVRVYVAVFTNSNLYVFAMIFGAANLVRVHGEWVMRRNDVVAAGSRLARLEMDELQAHLRPEFLFMTLRGIGRLLHRNPAEGDRMIVDLSDLLRSSLAGASSHDTLGESLEQLDRYVALHAAASETAMRLELDVDEHLLSVCLPVVVAQPLVEAAVIHIAARGGGRIHAGIARAGSRLQVRVRAEGRSRSDSANAAGDGILQVLRGQLERLYGADFILDVQAADIFTATLDMPFDPIERTTP